MRERGKIMNTTTQLIVRVAFVAMLLVGAACNKMDRTTLSENAAADARGELTAEQAQNVETERVHALQDRVEFLQAQLKDVHPLSAKADVPGGDYIE
jgi:uncharacterized protein YlxW (UPF0749 family)